jgi:hypothetical protein
MLMITLQRRRLEVMLMFRSQLVSGRSCLDTTRSVERHVHIVVDDRVVIYVGDVDAAHIHDRAVIEVSTTAPVTALKPNTTITEAVIDTAVEADVRAPVATVPRVNATAPAPVPGRPQQSGRRRQHPRARHPVITLVTISPVPGCPHIARRRQRRLHIHRKRRRRDVDRHTNRDTGVRNRGEHGERSQR